MHFGIICDDIPKMYLLLELHIASETSKQVISNFQCHRQKHWQSIIKPMEMKASRILC